MPNRELASVADNLGRSFVSRNNDIDGWWGVGVVVAALAASERSLHIDLLTGQSQPDLTQEASGLRLLPATWATRFNSLIERQKVRSRVAAASLNLQFLPIEGPVDGYIQTSRATEPPMPLYSYSCSVQIRDVRGRTFARDQAGYCHPHDERAEQRSGGPNRMHVEASPGTGLAT
jgi:hypothetical protein